MDVDVVVAASFAVDCHYRRNYWDCSPDELPDVLSLVAAAVAVVVVIAVAVVVACAAHYWHHYY